MTDGRRVLLDRGRSGATPEMVGEMTVVGNLIWPDDVDSYTPPPEGDLWFARDVAGMAKVLNTEPVLVSSKTDTGQGVEPLPLGISGIPNNHLQYAITWFSLAAIWAGMTVFALWRIRRGTN
jgi:surfeit locus 1 family protein